MLSSAINIPYLDTNAGATSVIEDNYLNKVFSPSGGLEVFKIDLMLSSLLFSNDVLPGGDDDDLDDDDDDEIDLDEELEIEADEVDVESIEIDDEDELIDEDDDDLDDDDIL